jgi:hypothetical protein
MPKIIISVSAAKPVAKKGARHVFHEMMVKHHKTKAAAHAKKAEALKAAGKTEEAKRHVLHAKIHKSAAWEHAGKVKEQVAAAKLKASGKTKSAPVIKKPAGMKPAKKLPTRAVKPKVVKKAPVKKANLPSVTDAKGTVRPKGVKTRTGQRSAQTAGRSSKAN